MNIVGVAEVAKILEWDKRKVATYIKRGKLPPPATRLKSGPIWDKEVIEEYKKNNKEENKMKIIKILNQNRRDFTAIYECESCGDKVEKSGYDDRNFHDNVMPNTKCGKCGKSSNNLGITHEPTPTKYEAWEVI